MPRFRETRCLEYVFAVVIVNLIQHKMAEGKHGIDDVEVAGKRALHSVIDDSVISEKIVAKEKVLRLDIQLKLQRFIVGLMSTLRIISFYMKSKRKSSHSVEAICTRGEDVYYDLIQLLSDLMK